MDVLLKKYFWVVNLTVVGLCAFFAGRAVTHALTSKYLAGDTGRQARRQTTASTAVKTRGKTPDDIVARNIFCSACSPPEAKNADSGKSQAPSSNDPVKTSLSLELVSTMVCPDDDAWSVGILRNLGLEDKDPRMYARGMKLNGAEEAEIVKVVSRRVYLRNAGKLEYVEMDGATPPAAAAPVAAPAAGGVDPMTGDIDKGVSCQGTNCTVERALVEKMLSNTAMLATSARFVPSMKDGKPNGFKLYAIRPNSIFGKIGLQNGDTIKAINGNEMTTPDKALEVYTKLRNASHLGVQVERRGETISLDYTIR